MASFFVRRVWAQHRKNQQVKALQRVCDHPQEFHSFPVWEPHKSYSGPGTAVAMVYCKLCGMQVQG